MGIVSNLRVSIKELNATDLLVEEDSMEFLLGN